MNLAIALNQWWISQLTTLQPTPDYLRPLKAKGHTLRSAAGVLGVHHGHLHRVLRGERESRSLSDRVASLPRNPNRTPA